ncbi:MAG: DUF3397 family protein [Lactobacillales bacterium]|nr:DUF3397 family protein [Lactobacillales bacterium]
MVFNIVLFLLPIVALIISTIIVQLFSFKKLKVKSASFLVVFMVPALFIISNNLYHHSILPAIFLSLSMVGICLAFFSYEKDGGLVLGNYLGRFFNVASAVSTLSYVAMLAIIVYEALV